MYVQYEKFLVTMGMQKPAEDRVPEVLAVQKSTPGFRSAHFMRGLGHLTHYLAVRVWESREAQLGFAQSPGFAEFNRKRPPNLYAAPPDMSYYDVAHEELGKASQVFAWCQEFHLEHGKARAWEEYAPLLHPALRSSAGFGGVQDLRYWGNGEEFVRVSYWESQEALLAFLATPESLQWSSEMPKDLLHKKPTGVLYQVVHSGRAPE